MAAPRTFVLLDSPRGVWRDTYYINVIAPEMDIPGMYSDNDFIDGEV